MRDKIHIFNGANFGDLYETRDGCRAVYLNSIETLSDEPAEHHALYIENAGRKYYYDEGFSIDGATADDIIGRYDRDDEELFCCLRGWQAANISDCLNKCRRYIAAVEKRNSKDGKRIAELLKMIDYARKYVMI